MPKTKKEEKVCPNCGFCPTCKRPMQTAVPWPTYPWYWFGPYYPYPPQPYGIPIAIWGTTTVIADCGDDLSSGNVSFYSVQTNNTALTATAVSRGPIA